jgi:hypothetical protein
LCILDCETVDSTYASLERILGLHRRELDEFFEKADIEVLSECSFDGDGDPSRVLLSELQKQMGAGGDYQQTCWFHLTRSVPDTTFEEGILPLPQCRDRIWETLYLFAATRVSRAAWDAFRTNMGTSHYADLYSLKMEGAIHWGPLGMLVKDHAFIPEDVGNHDYLRGSETVEDICWCFKKQFGYDLLNAYRRATLPVIVKFTGPAQDDCLPSALYHLYNRYHSRGCSLLCSTNYDSEGVPISRDRIVAVEFVPSGISRGRSGRRHGA